MRSVNNLKLVVPRFFEQFIDSNLEELCQCVEFQDCFAILTHSKFDNQFIICKVEKPTTEPFDECDLFDGGQSVVQEDFDELTPDFEEYNQMNELHDLANYKFKEFLKSRI